jgi:dipeptidyl aminopeptidase/acylaminoacyl peptidase
MRNCLPTLVLLILLGGCQGAAPESLPPASPGLELQKEGFAEARAGFRTTLRRKGPSPQYGDPLERPPGASAVDYKCGGLTLRAYVDRDPGDGVKRPAVLFLHGGFAFGLDDWAVPQPFRDAGYVVMVPVLRGENGQPGDFTMFFDEVDDVLAAADVLARLPYVDGTRLYISGHSAGGSIALLAALTSERFRAATSLSGDPDQKAHTINHPDLVVFDRSDIREYRLRSSVAYATSFRCPARLFYGEEETIWAESPNRRTAMLAREAGLDVAAVEVPGDHFSSVPRGLRESIAFFRKH